MKKYFVIVMLILISASSHAAITNYQVPPQIPLGKNLVISGQLDSNAQMNCSFYLYEAETGEFVYQLSDEKTSSNGYISSSYFVLPGYNPSGEQITYVDRNYNVRTLCGADSADANFTVVKALPLTDKVGDYIEWLRDNWVSAIFIIGGLVILFTIAAWVWSKRR